MSGTKAQMINFIVENYETKDGSPASMVKLDSFKKAELEKFLVDNNEEERFGEYLKSK